MFLWVAPKGDSYYTFHLFQKIWKNENFKSLTIQITSQLCVGGGMYARGCTVYLELREDRRVVFWYVDLNVGSIFTTLKICKNTKLKFCKITVQKSKGGLEPLIEWNIQIKDVALSFELWVLCARWSKNKGICWA